MIERQEINDLAYYLTNEIVSRGIGGAIWNELSPEVRVAVRRRIVKIIRRRLEGRCRKSKQAPSHDKPQ